MCGRFAQITPVGDLVNIFEVTDGLPLQPRYNIAPTQDVAVVRVTDHQRQLALLRWGLVPRWAKDLSIGFKTFNARSETVHEKPSFKAAFKSRRCLIPADGFYEWKRLPKGKLPHYIYRADGRPLALAGIWASWKDPDGGERVATCSIITGRPNDLVADIHDRMPVILDPERFSDWLARGPLTPGAAEALLVEGVEFFHGVGGQAHQPPHRVPRPDHRPLGQPAGRRVAAHGPDLGRVHGDQRDLT